MMEAVIPQEGRLTASFTVSDERKAIASGNFEVRSQQRALQGIPRSAKQMTAEYLSDYQKEANRLAIQLMQEVANAL